MEDNKKLEKSVLKVFDKVHNPTNESSEAEALELLSKLPNPAEVRDEDEDQFTLLHHACHNGWFEVSKVLIEEPKCDLYCVNGDGSIPLHQACLSGNLDLVKYLILDKGCDPNYRNRSGLVPLHNAAFGGHLDVTKFLIKHPKVDSTCEDSRGCTPLHFACQEGYLNVTKCLIEKQTCDPDCKTLILHSACLMGHLHIVKYLIEEQICDPICRQLSGGTPLHFACEGGYLNVVKYLIEENHIISPIEAMDHWTPLHSACKSGHLNIAKYLIEECNCDPMCRTDDSPASHSPLSLACKSHQLDLVKFLVNECKCNLKNCDIKLSDTFKENDPDITLFLVSSCEVNEPNIGLKNLLLHPAFKVFVMGNFSSGKSTLIKAIQEHLQAQPSAAQKLMRQYRKVSDVNLCTAGIVSTDIQVPGCGRVIMYDFAGQAEYYSSHAALCENLMTSQGCLVIIVFNLSKALNECIHELHFWQLFVNNQVRLSAHYPPIMFVASHADVVKAKGLGPACEAKKVIEASFGGKFHDQIVFLDCRQKYSPGLQTISDNIARYCSEYQGSTVVESKVHLLLYLIKSHFKEKVAWLLEDMFKMITSLNFFKQESIAELSAFLMTLNESGEILFLKNDTNIDRSWVILTKDVLLNEINGTIFAPKGFKNYHDISNSTGVVPLSNIRRLFPHHDPQMLIGFMMHLELCHEISTSEASLISRENSCSALSGTNDSKSFYFFPALVKVELSNKDFFRETNYYKYGWCLQRVAMHQCLTSRFLHTLLLRLAFTFALQCKQSVGSIVIQRKCNIWKNGIHWVSNNGVEVVVEIVEQSTAVVVVLGCGTERNIIKCLQLRSAVVHTVLETIELFCGELKLNEYVIDPDELDSYPLTKNIDALFKYSMNDLAMALKEQKEKQDLTICVTDQIGEKIRSVEVEKLLYFEPYACLSDELIHSYLYSDGEELNETVSDNFLLDFATTASLKSSKLKEILPLNESELDGAVALSQRSEQYKADRRHQCLLLLRTWRDSNENTNYNGLRKLLDSFSIFCGRNPLVSDLIIMLYKYSSIYETMITFLLRILSRMFITQYNCTL
jgi:ankyrin repeat protein